MVSTGMVKGLARLERMPSRKSKPPLRPIEDAYEPLMGLAALFAALWIGYALYNDRIFPETAAQKSQSHSVSAGPSARDAKS